MLEMFTRWESPHKRQKCSFLHATVVFFARRKKKWNLLSIYQSRFVASYPMDKFKVANAKKGSRVKTIPEIWIIYQTEDKTLSLSNGKRYLRLDKEVKIKC